MKLTEEKIENITKKYLKEVPYDIIELIIYKKHFLIKIWISELGSSIVEINLEDYIEFLKENREISKNIYKSKNCCKFCEKDIIENKCISCDANYIDIKLSSREKIYDNRKFIKVLEDISGDLGLDSDVITTYIMHEGKIEDIIEGIKIIENDYETKIALSKKLKLKENIIKNDILYNMCYYLVDNEFINEEIQEGYDFNNTKIYSSDEKILNRKIFIHNSPDYFGGFDMVDKSNCIYLSIRYDNLEVLPTKKCSYELLEEEKIDELNDYAFEELELDVIDCEYQYTIKFQISLTEDLENNLILIENNIKNEHNEYLKRVEKVKKHNIKYFEVVITKENVDKF
tara:strand:- start:6171 stop:7199 length:1029 start_codon:yes stop_codon:yes gene_type:complete